MYSFLSCQSVGAATSIGGLATGLFGKIRKMMIKLMIKPMTPFMTEKRFLEAPLVRQADGELKNCPNLSQFFFH